MVTTKKGCQKTEGKFLPFGGSFRRAVPTPFPPSTIVRGLDYA